MARSLLGNELSDLCLGKPALRSLSVSDTVADALSALKRSGDTYLSVWSCNHSLEGANTGAAAASAAGIVDDWRCIGKVCLVDVICFLCKEENLSNPGSALQSPLSVLIPKSPNLVRHLEPNASLVEAIDLILEGAQNIVIPLHLGTRNSRKKLLHHKSSSNSTLHNNQEFCWLTQEDIIRYLLNSIGHFCPTPVNPINALGIIDTNVITVHYHAPAASALPFIAQSLMTQTSVAVVDLDGKLIGEISPLALNACDESVAAAIMTLSAGDVMAYIDCGGPPEDLVHVVKDRLLKTNLEPALELMEEDSFSSYSSSSDDEVSLGKSGRLRGYAARVGRRSEANVCYPQSSLMAVMIQALAHRANYVWVVEEDGTLAGIVTFTGMIKVFREHMKGICFGQ
ncbi:hypothetical protein SLA2020_468390 [Shorea laevis]